MGVQQGTSSYPKRIERHSRGRGGALLWSVARAAALGATLVLALALLGGARPSTAQQERARLVATTTGWTFSITQWMTAALLDKVELAFSRTPTGLSAEEEAALVLSYLERAGEIRETQRAVETLYAEIDGQSTADRHALTEKLEALRTVQQENQVLVEEIIQRQVSAELARRGITLAGRTFPPVQFTFSEPPKKFVVSPRDRIETHYYRMLEPEFGTESAEQVEQRIADEFDLSGYVTRIGGMGAYPTMVVESPSLLWVFSTVAHEWVHNYLTLHPLGLSYTRSRELTTINETVAEIVGNEVGEAVVRRHYPAFAPPEPDGAEPSGPAEIGAPPPSGPTPFDFRTEMRRTRLTVDRLLHEGRIELAEAYMESQRQKMVEQGYPLRKLNQAYFAFHGSYGTSAASTDPIVPRLFALRSATPGIEAFLQSVRGITSLETFEATLEAYGIAP